MSGPSRRIRLTLPVQVTAEGLLAVMRRQDNRLFLRGEVFWSKNVYSYGDLLTVLRANGLGVAVDAATGHGQAVSTLQLVGMAEGAGLPVLLYGDVNAKGYSLAQGETLWPVKMDLTEEVLAVGASLPTDPHKVCGQFISEVQAIAFPSLTNVAPNGYVLGIVEGSLFGDAYDAKEYAAVARGYLIGSLNPGSDAGLALVLTSVGESANVLHGDVQNVTDVRLVSDCVLVSNCTAEALMTYTVTFMVNGQMRHQAAVFEGYPCPDPVATGIIDTPTRPSDVQYHYGAFIGWSTMEDADADVGSTFLPMTEYTGFAYDSDYGLYASHTDDVIELVAGETYNVSWDGILYSCQAQSLDGMTGIQLGNLAVIGGSGNNEPFIIGVGQYGTSYFAFDEKSTHTIGIAKGGCLDSITSDTVVYAAYEKELRYYTISFVDDDLVTVLHSDSIAYGEMPSYTPEKEGFIFDGWIPDIALVTGEATYVAKWVEEPVTIVASGNCGVNNNGVFADNATWELNSKGLLTVSGTGEMGEAGYVAQSPFFAIRTKIKSIVINPGITKVGAHNFTMYNASASCATRSISLPNTLLEIGKSAFQYQIIVESITLPSSLTTLRSYALSEMWALTRITIPASVTRIDQYAFSFSDNITSVVFEDPSGWKYSTSATATTGTALAESALSDPTTAATYLITKYKKYYWFKST